MGVFRPVVSRAQRRQTAGAEFKPSERILTPPNAMTASRPILALKAAEMLIHGKRGVTPVILAMAATDMEGTPARLIDKFFPRSGMGSSEFGGKFDPVADTSALLIISGALLKAPRVSKTAKLAVGTVLATEANKAVWYHGSSVAYAEATKSTETPLGSELILPVSLEGKEAMVEKFAAVALAAATNDTSNPRLRAVLSTGSLYFAGQGAWRGEKARRQMDETFIEMIGEALTPPRT